MKSSMYEGRARVQIVLTDELQEFLTRYGVLHQRELHHIHITEVVEGVVKIIDVSHATTHTCGEVTTRLAEYHHTTACHILTTVIACALDDGNGA